MTTHGRTSSLEPSRARALSGGVIAVLGLVLITTVVVAGGLLLIARGLSLTTLW